MAFLRRPEGVLRTSLSAGIVITRKLGKTLSYKARRQQELDHLSMKVQFEADLWIFDLKFNCRIFAFYMLFCQNFYIVRNSILGRTVY